jgi:hypothetical protein
MVGNYIGASKQQISAFLVSSSCCFVGAVHVQGASTPRGAKERAHRRLHKLVEGRLKQIRTAMLGRRNVYAQVLSNPA